MIEIPKMSGGKRLACLIGIPTVGGLLAHLALYMWNPTQYRINQGFTTPRSYIGKIADGIVIFQSYGSGHVFGTSHSSTDRNLLLVKGLDEKFTIYKVKKNLMLEEVVVRRGDAEERYSNSDEAIKEMMKVYQKRFDEYLQEIRDSGKAER